MKTPRYTDEHKYPHGYSSAAATDITKTFARERRRLAELAVKRKEEQIVRANIRRISK